MLTFNGEGHYITELVEVCRTVLPDLGQFRGAERSRYITGECSEIRLWSFISLTILTTGNSNSSDKHDDGDNVVYWEEV